MTEKRKHYIRVGLSEAHYQYLLELQKANEGMSFSRIVSQLFWYYKNM